MNSPVYPLEQVKLLAITENVRMTIRARKEARNEYDLDLLGVLEVIQGLTEQDFKESIVSRQTGQVNDVYICNVHSPIYCRSVSTYIKLEIDGDLIIISFHSQQIF